MPSACRRDRPPMLSLADQDADPPPMELERKPADDCIHARRSSRTSRLRVAGLAERQPERARQRLGEPKAAAAAFLP